MFAAPFVSPERLARWRVDGLSARLSHCANCLTRAAVSSQQVLVLQREALATMLAANDDYRVLRRLAPRDTYEDPAGSPTHVALYIDVETTGLDHGADRIIQLAITPLTFTPDGRVCAVRPSETWYEDPGIPISDEITQLTGIRQADVAGKRIDDARVGALLAESDLVVAHNAAFDRPFLEPRFPGFAEKPWGCSMADVPWIAEGLPSTKLEWLCERHAHVFYDAHRADIDTIAGIHLLASALPSGRRAMQVLLEGVRRKTVRVWALESPFATKGVLKARGYRWSGGEGGAPKAWWLEVREEDLEAEREWLALHVYRGEGCRAQVQRFGPKLRYSARIGTANLHPLIARPSAGDAGGDGRAP